MRFLLAIVLMAACAAPQTNHVNVAQVRDDIKDVIAHDTTNPRTIVSMGHTTADSATVYTLGGGARHEENWVHGPNGWTLANSKNAMN
jgi:hypothetical protein